MKRGVFIFWSLFIAIAFGRMIFSAFQEAPNIGQCLKQKVSGIGQIIEPPVMNDSGQSLIVMVDELKNGTVKCITDREIIIKIKTKFYPKYSYGQIINFSGKLSSPFNFQSDNGREFNYIGYLAKDDIYFEIKSAIVFLKESKESVDTIAVRNEVISRFSITNTLYSIKNTFVDNLKKTLGEPHAALAAGLVVGEKSALGKDLLNDFRAVGLIHIVVLSGFNITIVADSFRRILSFLPRVWGIVIGGLGISLFGVMVGGGATVVRSCLMSGVALSADLIRRDYNVIRALLLAGLIMIIQNPKIFFNDPSFQLSFLATSGLIILSKPFEEKIKFIPEKFGLRGTVATTLATQIFVSPFILYTMGQISIIGVIANILVLPIIPVTMFLVFLTGLSGFISLTLSQIIGWMTDLLLSYELFIVKTLADISWASISVPKFSGWWIMIFYLFIAIIILWKMKKSQRNSLQSHL